VSRPALPPAIVAGKVVAIARRLPVGLLPGAARALRDAGVLAVEVTLDGAEGLEGVRALAGSAEAQGMAIGAGTVLDIGDAERAVAAGATYLVSPHVDVQLIGWAAERGVPTLPGALTPTEVLTAWRAGAAAVKLFPADSLGPAHVKAIGGPLRDVPLVPTGGVTDANAAEYLAAGAVALGVGGWLLGTGQPEQVAVRAASLMAAVRGAGVDRAGR
jgi:2-dehydro-3-deoxyphosphogluconate aldolase/(4S)-4-hydroxy-2-oxoglutarate aldolase